MKSIDRPRYDSYVQAGQEFLKSSQAEPFTTKNFAKTIIEQME
jgi:wobble nucleotide-excising tRNase